MLRFRQENLTPSLHSKGGAQPSICLSLPLLNFLLLPLAFFLSCVRGDKWFQVWHYAVIIEAHLCSLNGPNSYVSLWPTEESCNILSSRVCLQYLFLQDNYLSDVGWFWLAAKYPPSSSVTSLFNRIEGENKLGKLPYQLLSCSK